MGGGASCALHREPKLVLGNVVVVRGNGVRTLIAGHTHTTTERRTDDFALYTVSGTAMALDDRGTGYTVFRVIDDAVETEFVRI